MFRWLCGGNEAVGERRQHLSEIDQNPTRRFGVPLAVIGLAAGFGRHTFSPCCFHSGFWRWSSSASAASSPRPWQ